MPLIIDHRKDDDLTCPKLCCDVCRELIEDADDGILTWDSEQGERVEPQILHKKCDLAIPRTSKARYWMGLDELMVYLLNNLKIDESKLTKARQSIATRSKLTA